MKYVLAILFPAIGLMIGSLAIPFGIFIGVFSYFFVSHMTETSDFPPMASTSDSASGNAHSDTTPDNDQDDLFESDTIESTLFSEDTTTFDDNAINTLARERIRYCVFLSRNDCKSKRVLFQCFQPPDLSIR